MPILIRDYETRSKLDLPAVGAWRYSQHPSTDIWCCAYGVDDGEIKLWLPGEPIPAEFIEAANNPDWLVCAFNDQFERLLERHILGSRYGFPMVPIERHRCLQAAVLARALPGSLDGAASALKLAVQKDLAGRRVMLQMARPRKPRKGEDPNAILWFDGEERRQQLHAYCKQDVATERELHRHVPFLDGAEQALWILDQQINDRGVYIDRPLLNAALRIAEQGRVEINAELATATAGEIDSVHQVGRLLEWLNAHGAKLKSITKASLEKELTNGLPESTRRVIQLRLDGAHAAANKLDTMRAWLAQDNRARGTLKFHGASTGRWSSYGIQLQNLKKPLVGDIDQAINAVASGSLEKLRQHYPRPISVVGDITRGLICAAPGHRLIAGDLSGIESRVTAFVSGQKSKLDMWRRFDETQNPALEPYFLIGKMLGVPEDKARAVGKIADLAFGYQGGVGAWRKLAPEDPASDDQIKQLQRRWHDAHPRTKQFWTAINEKAVKAVRTPDRKVQFQRPEWRHVAFESDGSFLFMYLPSGRKLAYPFPSLRTASVVFMDTSLRGWSECRNGAGAYGGTWTENAVQAIARDIIAEGMVRLETAGYRIVLHVHDEVVAEVPDGFGSAEEFQRILITPPTWATDLPLAAKVRNGARFCKSNVKPIEPDPIEELTEPAAEPPPFEPEPESEQPAAEEPQADNTHEARTEEPQNNSKHAGKQKADGYPHGERNTGHQVAFFIYNHADNRPYLKVKKTSTKQFPQFHLENGRWVKGPPKGPKIPYHLPELIKAPLNAWVVIAAGEKDADTAAGLGFIATTNPEGERKGAWAPELNAWFQGRCVAIMEDHDATGEAHVIEVAEQLRGIASDIRIVTFHDLPLHGDLTDWMHAEPGRGYKELLAKIEAAVPYYRKPRPSPIRQWEGEPIPELLYAVTDRFPLENVGLFSGEGGQGKSSLVQQLCVAHTLAGEWLGCTPRQGPAIYIECEDAERVLHWRLTTIAEHYKVPLTAIADAGFQMFPLADEQNTILATAPDKSGIIRPTPLYDWLYELAGDIKPVMIGIASSANVFAGNENVRTEVQQFIRLLRRIACVAGGTVLLVTQPSISGIGHKSASHAELSGTTQWHNAVRARAAMISVKPEDGIDTGLRQIKFHKNQYGPPSSACFVRYSNGLFLPVEGMSMDEAERATKADEIFVALLRLFTTQKRKVSANINPTNYAPTTFARLPESEGFSRKELTLAMERLLKSGIVENRTFNKGQEERSYLALAGT
jgi:DNA polymerase